MLKKRTLSILILAVLCISLFPAITSSARETPIPIFEDPSYSFEERAADLVARMTPAQKGGQMIDGTSAITAAQLGGGALNVPATLGVSNYRWWQEALHGYSHGTNSSNAAGSSSGYTAYNAMSYATSYSAGSSWDPDQYYIEATNISDEIRESSAKVGGTGPNAANNKNLGFYSPTVNLSRDPRWGRNEEGYSEDPYLAAVMGGAFVNGMQGNDKNGQPLDRTLKLTSTTKHYTANNSERNRLTGGATVTMRELREYYTAVYRDIIQDAHVNSVMHAYSSINNEPVSKSSYLTETLLRQAWGFGGYVTSDCDSYQTIKNFNYINPYTGKALTPVEWLAQIMAGGGDHQCNGGHASGDGNTFSSKITQMLAEKPRTNKGLFTENQLDISAWRHFVARMKTGEFDSGEYTSKYVTEAAARIAAQPATVARQTPERLALADKLASDAVVMLRNENVTGTSEKLLPLKPLNDGANIIIIGEGQTSSYLGLYSPSHSSASQRINVQQGIVNAINAANPGKTINYTYITANTLTTAQEETVSAADLAIVTIGTQTNDSREDGDRTTIVFPRSQADLAAKVGGLNPKTVVVMETCGPMQTSEFMSKVPAVLWSSIQGMRKVGFGNVITGAVNPGGRLTAMWHNKVIDNDPTSDIPSILDYTLAKVDGKPGRTYMYFDGPVAFEFGYGLSYSTFAYSNLQITRSGSPAAAFTADETVTVSFDITNTSAVAGAEVAQLYVSQPDAPSELLRPIARLKGFQKVMLNAGETKTVTLNVKVSDLAFYNEAQDKYLIDQGVYKFWVGQSSRKEVLASNITVSGQVTLVPAVVTAKPSQTGDDVLEVEERLIFDKGVTVNPKIAVALNDESLYGYIIKDQQDKVKHMPTSVPFPEGMTISYSSNRPSVVAVSETGVISTVGIGVATVTATVTYNGVSKTGSFVVYVVSTPYIDDIKVNGASVEGFDKAKADYSITLPSGTTEIPQVSYVSSNADVQVTVTQITSIPGIATITTLNTASGATFTYRVGFLTPPKSDNFSAGAIGSQWTVLNPNATNVSVGENGLSIVTESGFFGSSYAPKNVYLQTAAGDWVAQTRVTLSEAPSASNQQAGLIMYNNDTNYIRFVFERPTSGTTNVIRVYNVVNGTQTQVNTANATAGATSMSFQIVKSGNVYTFMYSANGTAWTTFATKVTAAYVLPQIGILANTGNAEAASLTATFNRFDVVDIGELYPVLSSLTLDGQPLAQFTSSVYNYTLVPQGSTVPVVDATSANPAHTVTINQATSLLGSATVTVASQVASAVYTVYFSENPTSDYMADGQIDDKWTIQRSDPANWSIVKGRGVVLKTQLGDLAGSSDTWTSLFTRPAAGNWEVVVKFHLPVLFSGNYHQAQVLAMQDANNLTRVTTTNPLLTHTGVETNGTWTRRFETTRTAASDSTFTSYVYIKKDNDTYITAQSVDGVNFHVFNASSPFEIKLNNTQIAIFATQTNQPNTPIRDVCYEYVDILSLNGVKVRDYEESLQWALDNVADYVAADVPTTAYSDIAFSSVPHGYTVSMVSSDPDTISNTGVVTRGAVAKTVQLDVTVSEGTRTNTKTINVVVPKKAVIDTITSVDSVVYGYAANVVVKTTGTALDGLTATLFGKTASIKDNNFYFNFAASEIPEGGSYAMEIYDGIELVTTKSITVLAPSIGLWTPALVPGPLSGPFSLKMIFAEKIAPAAGGYVITHNGALIPNIEMIDEKSFYFIGAASTTNTVTISKVKYPDLFPKYSFTFTATYNS